MRLINCQKVEHFFLNFLEVTVVFLIGIMLAVQLTFWKTNLPTARC